jgi:hypothetical protein
LKPLALDLCCGKGGWTAGLLATGWEVIGVDIEAWPGYPYDKATHIKTDVRNLFLNKFEKGMIKIFESSKISLVVASPPCQEFSYRSFPFKRCRELAANVPPDKSIWQACERIARECNAPLVLENVRGAQKYMGKAVAHYGSFYLWGDVPAMLPIGRPVKGFIGSGKKFPGEMQRERWGWSGMQMSRHSSHLQKRKEFSAQAAMIPIELSTWVGKCFYPQEKP